MRIHITIRDTPRGKYLSPKRCNRPGDELTSIVRSDERERGIFNSMRAISSWESDWNQDPRSYMGSINYLAIQLRDRSSTVGGQERPDCANGIVIVISLWPENSIAPARARGRVRAAYSRVPRNTGNFHGAVKSTDIEYPLSRRP